MDRFEELKKYKELMDEGIITEEEFDALKKEFLAAPAIQPAEKKSGSNSASEDFGAILKNVGIDLEERKKEFIGDYNTLKKEGVKGFRKLSAGTIMAFMFYLIMIPVVIHGMIMFTKMGQDKKDDSNND